MPGKINIIGTSRSGLSLLGAILDCSILVSIKNDDFIDKAFKMKLCDCLDNINLFAITPFCFKKYKHKILDALIIIKELSDGFVWVVRDPILSVCSYIRKFDMNINEAFEYWFQVNCILWYMYFMTEPSRRLRIKFEDLLLNPEKTKEVFDLCNIDFSHQFIQYGDFDHNYPLVEKITLGYPDLEHIDPYPKSQQVQDFWKQYTNEPIVRWLNYNRIDLD